LVFVVSTIGINSGNPVTSGIEALDAPWAGMTTGSREMKFNHTHFCEPAVLAEDSQQSVLIRNLTP
jgi:hypothetical protein